MENKIEKLIEGYKNVITIKEKRLLSCTDELGNLGISYDYNLMQKIDKIKAKRNNLRLEIEMAKNFIDDLNKILDGDENENT